MILFGKLPIFIFLFLVCAITALSIPSKSKMGMIYFNSYEYDKALDYLSEVDSFKEGDVLALKKIKDYFTLQGNIKKSLNIMEKLYELRPHNIEYLLELETLADWNQLPEKKLKYQEIRADLYTDVDEKESTLLKVAQGFRYVRNFEEANRVFERLKASQNIKIHDALINYYLTTKQAAKAIEQINNYKELSLPNMDESFVQKYQVYLYQSFTVLEDHESAIKQAMKIIGISEKFTYDEIINELKKYSSKEIKEYLYYIEGIIYHLSKLTDDENEMALRQFIVDKLPLNLELKFDLAEGYYRKGDKKTSLSIYESLLTHKSLNRNELLDMGNRFYDLNEKNLSIKVYERLTVKFPLNRLYWKRLGEMYEENGQKKKALECFLKILELNKKKKRVHYRGLFKEAVKLVLNKNEISNNYLEKYKKIPNFNFQSREMEGRVVNLLNEIGDLDQMISVLKDLLSDDPNSSVLLSGLAQAYYAKGEISKSEELFERSLLIDDKQVMALEVIISRDLREQSYDKAHDNLSKLILISKNINRDYIVSLKEEILYGRRHSTKGLEEYNLLCREVINQESSSIDYKRIKVRCLRRIGEVDDSYKLSIELLSEYPNDLSLREEIVYQQLDRKLIFEAKENLDYLTKHNQDGSKSYKSLKNYYEDVKMELDRKKSWYLNSDNYHLWTTNFSFTSAHLDISRQMDNFKLGVQTRSYLMNNGGAAYFNYSEVYLSYRWKDKHLFRSMLGITHGDKNISESFGFGYSYGDENTFFNLDYNHSMGSFQTASLFLDEKSFERGINSYLEHALNDQIQLNATFDYFDAYTKDSNSSVLRLRGGVYYRWEKNACFQTGGLLGYSNIGQPTISLENGYLKNSLPYYLLLKCDNHYLRNDKQQKWLYLGEIGIGGDAGRDISFINSNLIRAELSYLFSLNNSVKLYGEHYTEALNAANGATSMVGIQLQFFTY